MRTDVAGKLVKKLVQDGAHLKKGDAYCEIEVMKMFMPLKVTEAGIISWQNNEGAALSPGDLIGSLELDCPDNVATTTLFDGDLHVDGFGVGSSKNSKNRPHIVLRNAFELLQSGMSGYIVSNDNLEAAFKDLLEAVTNPLLPVYEIEEPLSVLSGRLDAKFFEALKEDVSDSKAESGNNRQ